MEDYLKKEYYKNGKLTGVIEYPRSDEIKYVKKT